MDSQSEGVTGDCRRAAPAAPEDVAAANAALLARIDDVLSAGAENCPGIAEELLRACRAALAERIPREPTEARQIVEQQALDEGLWFRAETITEDYLQTALRKLHAAVEAVPGIPRERDAERWQCRHCGSTTWACFTRRFADDCRRAAPKMGDSPAAPDRDAADVEFGCAGAEKSGEPVFMVRTKAARSVLTRNRALEGAIEELVACKDLKDELESDLIDPMPWTNEEWEAKQADYERRKPLAWAAARKLIEAPHGPT